MVRPWWPRPPATRHGAPRGGNLTDTDETVARAELRITLHDPRALREALEEMGYPEEEQATLLSAKSGLWIPSPTARRRRNQGRNKPTYQPR